jgi:hypothetical protein
MSDPAAERVALAIMLSRFGRTAENPPKPDDRVPIDLSTDLARSLERNNLTSFALNFLQSRPFLPFTWKQTSKLDLFKELTFKKYAALCLIQLERQTSARLQVEESIRKARDSRRASAPPAEGRLLGMVENPSLGELLEVLVAEAALTEGEDFAGEFLEEIPLEGQP